MKKNFLLLAGFFILTGAYAQDAKKVSTD